MRSSERIWWKEGIVYQIYPRSFYDSNGDGIGDLQGIIKKLDYIKKLGIDIIWLNPVYQSPNDDMGYDISDYHKINPEYGHLSDMDQLIEEIHNRGMKLIMDLVINHTSSEHPWFMESKKSKDNLYRDFYIWRQGENGKEPNNWASFFEGSAWKYEPSTGEYYLHLFTEKQVDLNWENPRMREKIYSMMKWWLDKKIDGFRLDVINMISKDSQLPSVQTEGQEQYGNGRQYFVNGPKVHEYLQEMNREIFQHYDIMTVGECPATPIEEAVKYVDQSRNELNMIFKFEHVGIDQTHHFFSYQQWKLSELKKIFTRWQNGLKDGWNSIYLMNHDQPRTVTRFGNDKEYRAESAKMLATFYLSLKGTPFIYQGDEIGMTNVAFKRIEDYRDVATINYYRETVKQGQNHEQIMKNIHFKSRDNSRTPMQWDDSKNSGFSSAPPWLQVNPNYPTINVTHSLKNPHSIFHYYQKMITLRKKYLTLVYGDYQIINENDESIYAYFRKSENDQLLIILNFTNKKCGFTIPQTFFQKNPQLLITNYQDIVKLEQPKIQLKPYESRIYQIDL